MNRYSYAPFIAALALFAGAANVFAADPVSFSATNLNVAVGGQQPLFVTLPFASQAPAGGLTIQLTSFPAGIVQVPASITIPATSGGNGFYVTGLSAGTATIVGLAPSGQFIFANVTVGPTATPTLAFSSAGLTVTAGTQQSLFVITSPAAPAGGITVALNSGSLAVATVPASVTIPAGATSAGFFVTGLTPGTATITGTAAGFLPITAQVTVVPAVVPNTIIFNQTNLSLASGTHQALFVMFQGPYGAPAGGLTVSLSSSNPSVATVPATLTIPATSNGVGFYVFGLTPGTTIITATPPPGFGPIVMSTVTVI